MTERSINHRATNNRSSATNQFLLHPSANVTWRHFSAKITRTTESISTRGQIAGFHGLQLDSQHVTRDLHVAAKKSNEHLTNFCCRFSINERVLWDSISETIAAYQLGGNRSSCNCSVEVANLERY